MRVWQTLSMCDWYETKYIKKLAKLHLGQKSYSIFSKNLVNKLQKFIRKVKKIVEIKVVVFGKKLILLKSQPSLRSESPSRAPETWFSSPASGTMVFEISAGTKEAFLSILIKQYILYKRSKKKLFMIFCQKFQKTRSVTK